MKAISEETGGVPVNPEDGQPGTPTDNHSAGNIKKVSDWKTAKLYFLPGLPRQLPGVQAWLPGYPDQEQAPEEPAGLYFVSSEKCTDIRLEAANLLVAIRDHDPVLDDFERGDIEAVLIHLDRSMRKAPIREPEPAQMPIPAVSEMNRAQLFDRFMNLFCASPRSDSCAACSLHMSWGCSHAEHPDNIIARRVRESVTAARGKVS